MGFSENLKKIRTEKGISQQELAKNIGVSQTAVYQWEKGIRRPKIDAIAKISTFLNIAPAQLFMTEMQEINGEKGMVLDFGNIKEDEIGSFFELVLPECVQNCKEEQYMLHSFENKENLLKMFDLLNLVGQEKALEQIEMLTKIPEYQNDPI